MTRSASLLPKLHWQGKKSVRYDEREGEPELKTNGNGKRGRVSERLSQILSAILFYTLLALIALTAIPYGAADPWWEAVFECAVFALTILWMVESLLSASLNFSSYRLFWPLLALAAFGFIQTLPLAFGGDNATVLGMQVWQAISADPFETRLWVFKMLAITLTGCMLLRYTSSQRRLHALVYLILAVAAASAMFGILRQTSHRGPAGFILPRLKPEFGYAQFFNRNQFAFLMEMALGLILGLVVGGGVRKERLLIYLALLMPVWAALVLSSSRAGILSMIGQLIFTALLATAVRVKRKDHMSNNGRPEHGGFKSGPLIIRVMLILCLVAVAIAGVLWLGGAPLVDKMASVQEEVGTDKSISPETTSRGEIWRATWQLIKAHPLVGVGFAAYGTIIPQYHEAAGLITPREAHNDYLELLASGGLVALALALWFLFLFARQARARLQQGNSFRRAVCFGALVGLFGVALHSSVDFGLHLTINAVIFIALVVIATVNYRTEGEGARSGPV